MRGRRMKRNRAGLFVVLVLIATLGGILMAKEWGGHLFSGSSIPEAAAAEGATPSPSPSPTPSQKPSPTPTVPNKPETGKPSDPTPGTKPPATKPTPNKDEKLVALTFDDGPDGKYTPQVLELLKKYKIKATFFLVGPQVEKYPDTVKQIVDEGHSIGNHTWSHKDMTKLTKKAQGEEIDKTQNAIFKAAGIKPHLMRAPFGALSDTLLETLADREMKHVYWTVDTKDWAGTSVAEMRKNVLAHTRSGGILLMHTFGGRKNALDHTVKLLPLIIGDLSKKGYKFVTVDELIDAGQAHASVVK